MGAQAARAGAVMRRLVVGIIVLGALFGLAVGAFVRMAQAATPHREGSIPWFMSLSDDTLVAAIVDCRSDLRASETQVCGNAEVAFDRVYARRLRASLAKLMQSPLFWLENPEQAANVREACSGNRRLSPNDAMLLRYCGAVSRVPMQGRRT